MPTGFLLLYAASHVAPLLVCYAVSLMCRCPSSLRNRDIHGVACLWLHLRVQHLLHLPLSWSGGHRGDCAPLTELTLPLIATYDAYHGWLFAHARAAYAG